MTIHAANAAMIKKLLLTVKIKSAEIPSTIFARHRDQSDPDRSDQDSRVQAV